MSLPPIAFVVQRYGTQVTGGAEQHCRAVARRLAAEYQVTVITTCALDHRTWANHFAAGESQEEGVRVLRFPVGKGRAPDFDAFSKGFYDQPRSEKEELRWLEKQGPNSPQLLDYLARHGIDFQAIVFYTYLYSPTVLGLPLVADRAALVSTAHDEPAIRLGIFRQLFSLPQHLVFLTSAEEKLVRRLFGNSHIPGVTVGTGIDGPTEEPDPDRFRHRYGIQGDFLLYMGRVEAGKGCAEMVDFFCRYRQTRPEGLSLVLLGKVDMPVPDRPDVVALGFVSEQDKWDALRGATLLIAPSPYESLSIALLEAWSCGVPVLANGRCAVLADQCLSGNGGLYYCNHAEFEACLDLLLAEPSLRTTLGQQGRRHVKANCDWKTVLPKWDTMLRKIAGIAGAAN